MPDFSAAVAIFVGGTFFGTLLFFTPLWGPRLIFRKLGLPFQTTSPLPAFSITDGLVLLVLLSPVNASASLLRNEMPNSGLVLLFVGANSIVVLTWILGLRIMERHRIRLPRSRLIFQLVIHPLAVFAPAGLVWGVLILLNVIGSLFEERIGETDGALIVFASASSILILTSLAVCYAARRSFIYLLSAEGKAKSRLVC